jgi:AraC-like DNA-binding protein
MPLLFTDLPGIPLPYRLRSLGSHWPQEPIQRPFGYPHHQWFQVRSGALKVEVADAVQTAKAGDGVYLAADEPHAYRAATAEVVVDFLAFDGPGVADLLHQGPLTRSGVYRLGSPDPVRAVLERAWDLASAQAGKGLRLSACVYELLTTLADEAAGAGQVSTAYQRGRLEPVLAALVHQPTHPWTVGQMAAILGHSPQSLGRLFRQALGQSPLEYLVRLRLNRALQLLAERPDLRVNEVGTAVGYPDTSYFVRLFRQREGLTPGQFQKLHARGDESSRVLRT